MRSVTEVNNTVSDVREYIKENSDTIVDAVSVLGLIGGDITFIQQTGEVVLAANLFGKIVSELEEEVPEGSSVRVSETHTWEKYAEDLVVVDNSKQGLVDQVGGLSYSNVAT